MEKLFECMYRWLAAMVGKYSRVVAHIKNMNSEIVYIHCLLHQHVLAVKRMPSNLVEVLIEVIKIVNFIKAQPLIPECFAYCVKI